MKGILSFKRRKTDDAPWTNSGPNARRSTPGRLERPYFRTKPRDPLNHFIAKALEKDRNLRYQSAAELRAHLVRMNRGTSAERIMAEAPPGRCGSGAGCLGLAQRFSPWHSSPCSSGSARFLTAAARLRWAPKTLAVIEIENRSQDPSLNWLGNGLVDLLTTDLAQAKSLDVIQGPFSALSSAPNSSHFRLTNAFSKMRI